MKMLIDTRATLLGLVFAVIAASTAYAERFDIPGGDLASAIDAFTTQSGITLVVSSIEIKGLKTAGVKGDLSPADALARMLRGTGFVSNRDAAGVLEIVRRKADSELFAQQRVAAETISAVPEAALETVTVTSSKVGGDIQNIPISITALSQEQLTSTQTAGGPDLVKQVPNMTFTKTNFSGYSIQLRGIGTQAISVTTDPAVAVAFNDIPFIRNHFFEQEFYDVSQVEVLRGPQGTLYGRNATAGVVNLISAKPTDQFEAMASLDVGNYGNRRPEGMINIPIVDDRLDIRIAGEWTKRQGYSFNEIDGTRTDGRDLWSGRASISWKPFEDVQTNIVWEHFSEDDDRMRTAKQLCNTAPIPVAVGGVSTGGNFGSSTSSAGDYLSQGCLPVSLYSPDAFEVPNGYSLSYYAGLESTGVPVRQGFDVYSSTTQSQNLRVIESSINPIYKAKNDTVELNSDYKVTPVLTFTSQTGYNHDFLWSTEDYNRFNSAPGAFVLDGSPLDAQRGVLLPDPSGLGICGAVEGSCLSTGAPCNSNSSATNACSPAGVFCDPQLGCSDRLVAQDLSDEHAWQLSQEFRLTSNFNGPLNFSAGGNYLHYETEENYYVFVNTLSLFVAGQGIGQGTQKQYVPNEDDNSECIQGGFRNPNPSIPREVLQCDYIDPNSLTSLNNEGHNYFLSQNPYTLNSYAAFGEVNYNIANDLKLIGGLRWTEDQKHFVDIPSELVVSGYGYAISGVVNQQWDQLTGRAAINWTPKLDFTDQTLFYGSYAHGYKAGGANPPGAIFPTTDELGGGFNATIDPIHPLTFKPEFIDAFELGTKNTLLDGTLTVNADVFYYNYENYQISEIVDRTAINLNFDAHVKGAEIESTWEPVSGLRFNFAGGWEDTSLAKGSQSVDLIDRTAGNTNWIVVKPFITNASNCVLPIYVVAAILQTGNDQNIGAACNEAYSSHNDPVTDASYKENPIVYANGEPLPPALAGYPGFDPISTTAINNGTGSAPNNGEGFDKNLSGNELPNAPPFTVSFGAQYTSPITQDWAGTLRGDYYWQDYSWARVFNDDPYDRLRGYTNVNLTLIFTNQNGWQVMLYDKNVFNTTAITGDFLNSDDSGLTTNVFLTDPKLIGIRVTKNW
jgi:iron complex outermembrane receptor protein